MPVYGPGSKCLGRAEKETEWLRFHAPQTPGNSHCAPTPFRTFLLLELHDCRFRPRDLYPIGSNLEGFDITFFPDCPRTSRCGRGRKGRDWSACSGVERRGESTRRRQKSLSLAATRDFSLVR